jgi:hypothetical protein
MAKDPAFLFYSNDFIGGVAEMTMEERGQYISLLCFQHQKGHLSIEIIQRLIPGVSDYVLNKFIKDEQGLYFNERLELEATKRAKFTESRRKNLSKPHMDSHMSEHMENINIDIDIIKEDNSNSNSNNIVIGENLKKKQTKSTYYPDDPFFIEQMALKGKRSCFKIGAPWVFLTDQNYRELINNFKYEELVIEMIKEYSGYKERKSIKARKPTLTLDDKDVTGISASWVEVNAIKVLQARNSPVIAEIRKKEKMKEKFNQK